MRRWVIRAIRLRTDPLERVPRPPHQSRQWRMGPGWKGCTMFPHNARQCPAFHRTILQICHQSSLRAGNSYAKAGDQDFSKHRYQDNALASGYISGETCRGSQYGIAPRPSRVTMGNSPISILHLIRATAFCRALKSMSSQSWSSTIWRMYSLMRFFNKLWHAIRLVVTAQRRRRRLLQTGRSRRSTCLDNHMILSRHEVVQDV